MVKSYSCDLRERVVRFVSEGNSRREAAAHFGVSASFAVKLLAHSLSARCGQVDPEIKKPRRNAQGLFLYSARHARRVSEPFERMPSAG
ncbi:hypothetical protein JDN40_17025 [Rhodomicrobium vannielii ATCC 17100]|nr:hypothetical protein [Rhodomicrobium vannielii ATCC 17100]